ncbi:MAG: succinate dehydrogenase/fumarate reductase iron-sulfur subunit [Halobacteriales archaeon]|nr:succinate dehydrogenase/fumarate reductase iron-sulfur subunit [Halobacteriales archaeon]
MSTGITKTDDDSTETQTQAAGAARAAGEPYTEMNSQEIDAANEEAQRHTRELVEEADRTVKLKVFRFDPDVPEKEEPRFDSFTVPFSKGMTVLDALMWARDQYDSSLTFRHSCRQAVCGSDALFVNGKQRLGCKTQVADLADSGIPKQIRIEPLPHAEVVKDLVVDMEHFYDQMESVEPYFQGEDTPDGLEEQYQSRENREKVKMSTRCIWCGACMSSCNIAAGNNDYLGPAAINKAYRFAMDDREGEDLTEHRLNIIEQEHGVWRCQTQFSCTEVCPKDIPLTEHIQELKREAVKKNLKFW